jgi:integration host factor subunit beta
MTKTELVDQMAATLQLPTHQTERIVTLFFQCITEALEQGDKVELRGFGSFRLRYRRPRPARNPRTGAPVQIPAKMVPWFTVGKDLRTWVNQPPQVPREYEVGRPALATAARKVRGQNAPMAQ